MKKCILLCVVLLCNILAVAQNYYPDIPEYIPSRNNAMGGFHTTDTTDFFTVFSNPAGITKTGEKSIWFTMDTTFSNPMLLWEGGRIAIDTLINPTDAENEDLIPIDDDFIALVGDNGINLGMEILGPFTVGSIIDMPQGAFGWAFFSKNRFFALIPTVTHMDMLAGIDTVLQGTYATHLISNDVSYLSFGMSAKGIFIFETGVSNIAPLSILTDIDDIANSLPLQSYSGFSFDMGLYYSLYDTFNVGLVWKDYFNYLWMHSFSSGNAEGSNSSESSGGFNQNRVDFGVGIDMPLGSIDKVVTNFIIMADYKDLYTLIANSPVSRNPILNLSFGTEVTLFDLLSLRVGIDEMYLNAGIGLNFGSFLLDLAIFGKELGLEPGSLPQLNASIGMSVHY